MLQQMLGIIRRPQRRPFAPERRSRLSFQIGAPSSTNVVEEIGANPRRAISKSGKGYVYAMLAELDGSDLRCLEIAKEHVISRISMMEEPGKVTMQQAAEIARSKLLAMTAPDKADILSYLAGHDTIGYGPISILMESRQNIEEIEINSPDSWITIYSPKYGRCITNLRFCGEGAFRNTINRMIADADKELNENTPIIDAQVADLRLHAQIRPYAVSGAAASIRIGGRKEITLDYLLRNGTAKPEMLAYLWMAMETKHNLIISGAPASGKTTFLSAITAFIPGNEKIITIEEDINEIRTKGVDNTIALYGSRYNSVSPREQVINSLRLRPSRIIVGEMRGEEAKDLFMGANLGISFAATMHSNEGGMQVLKKLMVKPMSVETKSLSTLDIAVCMRQEDISRRIASSISEYRWLSRAEIEEGEDVCGEDMVKIAQISGDAGLDQAQLRESKVLAAYVRLHRISLKDALKEFERRTRLISAAAPKGGEKSIEKSVEEYLGW